VLWVYIASDAVSDRLAVAVQGFNQQGFNQNDAALRFLQGQRMQQGGGNTAVADASELYTNAADLLSKAGMTGETLHTC
jgi:hypothetical protein